MDPCGFCPFFVVRFSCNESRTTSLDPRAYKNVHPIRNSQHYKSSRFQSYSGCFPTLCLQCLVFWWLRDSPSRLFFLCSTPSLIENLFPLPSALRGQRSGTARGQPPWSCDGFWILLKGTLACQMPIDTTLWTRLSDTFRFGKALQWKMMFSVWVSSGLITIWVSIISSSRTVCKSPAINQTTKKIFFLAVIWAALLWTFFCSLQIF